MEANQINKRAASLNAALCIALEVFSYPAVSAMYTR